MTGPVPEGARAAGIRRAMRVEKSGQQESTSSTVTTSAPGLGRAAQLRVGRWLGRPGRRRRRRLADRGATSQPGADLQLVQPGLRLGEQCGVGWIGSSVLVHAELSEWGCSCLRSWSWQTSWRGISGHHHRRARIRPRTPSGCRVTQTVRAELPLYIGSRHPIGCVAAADRQGPEQLDVRDRARDDRQLEGEGPVGEHRG